MNLMQFDPWNEVRQVESTVNRIFSDNMLWNLCCEKKDILTEQSWSLPVDVYETESEIVFLAELPGFKKDEVDISIKDGYLTIKVARQFTEEKGAKYYQVERPYGDFYRKFLLPSSVNNGKVKASLKKGILRVTLLKREEAKPIQVTVSAT